MANGTSSVLVFGSKRSVVIWTIPAGLVAVAVFIATSGPDKANDGLFFLLLACVSSSIASRRTTVHIDLRARKLRIFRHFFGQWGKTIVDCPFDQCRALGRIEYENGNDWYGVYVELLSGRRHAIPIKGKAIQEASRVAAQLAEATGIPRRDTTY